ncbi:MAG: hypothetical protein H0T89_18990 [Deltaproteobacteria bacterium]|nr:hypothetical protein [Deltaproteobacteria bacterium]MDQ3298796.1 hypothetical protein [Myxococcota bacterium]
MPKTLAEIAIEAGLVNRAGAAKAGKMAEVQKLPLVVVLVRELKIDEVALIGAIRRQTRVPLIDPGDIQIDPDALRQVPRDACARLRVLPLGITNDGETRVLRLAMADPTDTSAILEIESLTHCEIEVSALPLSAIDELVDKGYRQINTAIVSRPTGPGGPPGPRWSEPADAGERGPVAKVGKIGSQLESDSEVSVTAQISLLALQQLGTDDLEARFAALLQVLIDKGLVTEAELAEALKKPKPNNS